MVKLSELSQQIDAEFNGEDHVFSGAEIDSRKIQKGDVFICIKGPRFDGHDFAKTAIENGATALMVDHPLNLGVPEILVEETTKGLGKLAQAYRTHFNIPLIALTGSCGKTGTKEMLAKILQQIGPTLSTDGNYNNQYGLPLTLLRLKPEHQFAVIEMGTSGKGEIDYLARITRPTVALITNILDQHVSGLGSREGISAEKSDLFKYLTRDGIAVINGDEPYAETWEDKIETQRRVGYSLNHEADLTVSGVVTDTKGSSFNLHTPIGIQAIQVPLLGEPTVINALAAATAALSVGAKLSDVAKGLSQVKPVKGRLYPHHLPNNITVVDDTYNAGPMAVKASMDLLGKFEGKKIFVMSNMGELGDLMDHYHCELGKWAIENNLDHLLLTGQPEFLKGTLHCCDERGAFFNTQDLLVEHLLPLITANTTVIVKGSRGNRMEQIVARLLESNLNPVS